MPEERLSSRAAHRGRLLVVDDISANVRLLERLLTPEGYDVVTAADGEEANDIIARHAPDLVITDVRMPRRDGFQLCADLKRNPETRLIPVVLMTGASEAADRLQAIEIGADDFLAKPVDSAELKARVASLMRLKRFTDDLDHAEKVLLSLALTVEARDPNTGGHCQRLATYASALGTHLGLSDDEILALRRGGFFHDIGKIAMPDAILLKPGPLTPDERTKMMEHPVVGDRLCGDLRALHHVRPIVRHHHERQDGSGYPDGLRGADVPLLAQIIGVVDVFDALTSDRPYRAAMTRDDACAVLRDEVRRGWRDAGLVEAFLSAVTNGTLTT